MDSKGLAELVKEREERFVEKGLTTVINDLSHTILMGGLSLRACKSAGKEGYNFSFYAIYKDPAQEAPAVTIQLSREIYDGIDGETSQSFFDAARKFLIQNSNTLTCFSGDQYQGNIEGQGATNILDGLQKQLREAI
jgi:hypothetical protein